MLLDCMATAALTASSSDFLPPTLNEMCPRGERPGGAESSAPDPNCSSTARVTWSRSMPRLASASESSAAPVHAAQSPAKILCGHSVVAESAGCGVISGAGQSDQQVLGADRPIAEHSGFLLAEHDRGPRVAGRNVRTWSSTFPFSWNGAP